MKQNTDADDALTEINNAESGDQMLLTVEGGNEMSVEYCNDPTDETGELVYDGSTHYRVVFESKGLRLKSNEQNMTDYCAITAIES